MRLFAILLCVFPLLFAEQIFENLYYYSLADIFFFSYGFETFYWLFVNFDVLVIVFNYFDIYIDAAYIDAAQIDYRGLLFGCKLSHEFEQFGSLHIDSKGHWVNHATNELSWNHEF